MVESTLIGLTLIIWGWFLALYLQNKRNHEHLIDLLNDLATMIGEHFDD